MINNKKGLTKRLYDKHLYCNNHNKVNLVFLTSCNLFFKFVYFWHHIVQIKSGVDELQRILPLNPPRGNFVAMLVWY
jgi:hypothetical protein